VVYIIRDIHGDNEFEVLRETIRPINVNIVPTDSHVGEVERFNTHDQGAHPLVCPWFTVPEATQTHAYTPGILRSPVPQSISVENGISDSLSPASLVTGLANPDFWHMRLEFGAYAQVFEDNDPSNTIRARSLGAIALNPYWQRAG
jgi:hypothetical protein